MTVINEFMGLIHGAYKAKPPGFVPGGFSLHNAMPPHDPDKDAFEGASNAALKLHKLEGTMAFIFETRFPLRVTAAAAGVEQLQKTYGGYGSALIRRFDPTRP
jgi:homogentisate 1,2-dioxygenase